MNELDKLKPEVAAAIRTMSDEAGGNRDDAYDVIEAELLRLAEENAELRDRESKLWASVDNAQLHPLIERAECAEAELAALKARIAEAPVVKVTRDDYLENFRDFGAHIIGKRVRLLLDDGESA